MIGVAIAMVGLPPLQNVVERRLRASMIGGLAGTAIMSTSGALFQAFAHQCRALDVVRGERRRRRSAVVAALGPVLHQVEIKGGRNVRDYTLLAGLFTVTVLAYQAVWFIGKPGLRLISSPVELPILLVLDLARDVGLGILSVLLVERLVHEVKPEPGETAVAASARYAHTP